MDLRIGQGYDVHPLIRGYDLVIGGVTIDHEKGLKGHSDADVLTHAICDALLGAINKGDIGYHFPPSDPANKDINSLHLLSSVYELVKQEGYVIGNIDSTICIESPKLQPYLHQMQNQLANSLMIEPDSISVKATTTEQLGPEGRKEGISALAITLLHKID